MKAKLLKLCASVLLVVFTATTVVPNGYAQSAFVSGLPEPGKMVNVSENFMPILVKGLVVHPDRPLNFEFIVDTGNDRTEEALIKEQSERIVRYFLAALTVPEDQLWVNLSPYEKDRIIADELGQTVLGRDMLAQDYVLKQLTASMIYPEDHLGKEFWAKVYKEAQEKFGTTDIPVDTFNKVWIMPEKAEVFEKDNAVYVTQAKLKVMLDSDYEAAKAAEPRGAEAVPPKAEHEVPAGDGASALAKRGDAQELSKELIRQIVLPAIEREVNTGKNFATLRQVYYAAILAKWYRELIQDTLLSKAYVGQNKINGVNTDDKTLREQIYQRYIFAYKKGVFNYIKEESDLATGDVVPHKYFSGGLDKFGDIKLSRTGDAAMLGVVGKLFKSLFLMNSNESVSPLVGEKVTSESDLTVNENEGINQPPARSGNWGGEIVRNYVWDDGITYSDGAGGWQDRVPQWIRISGSDSAMKDMASVTAVQPLDLSLNADVVVVSEAVRLTRAYPMLTVGGSNEFDSAMGVVEFLRKALGLGLMTVGGSLALVGGCAIFAGAFGGLNDVTIVKHPMLVAFVMLVFGAPVSVSGSWLLWKEEFELAERSYSPERPRDPPRPGDWVQTGPEGHDGYFLPQDGDDGKEGTDAAMVQFTSSALAANSKYEPPDQAMVAGLIVTAFLLGAGISGWLWAFSGAREVRLVKQQVGQMNVMQFEEEYRSSGFFQRDAWVVGLLNVLEKSDVTSDEMEKIRRFLVAAAKVDAERGHSGTLGRLNGFLHVDINIVTESLIRAVLLDLGEAPDAAMADIQLSSSALAASDAAMTDDSDSNLISAVKKGDKKAVEQLLAQGVDVDTRGALERTALMEATIKNDVEMVKLLLLNGADVNAKAFMGRTALGFAVGRKERLEIVKLLLEKGADIYARDSNPGEGTTVLMKAVDNEISNLLLEKAGENSEGEQLFSNAFQGNMLKVKEMIQQKVNINYQSPKNGGATALIAASQAGHVGIVRLLLDNGANVDLMPREGLTALMTASEHGHSEIVKLLISAGAKLDLQNRGGTTALMSAIGHIDIIKLLIDKGAQLNLQRKDGMTALIAATYEGQLDTAKLLIEHEADLNVRMPILGMAYTALDVAINYGQVEIAQLLLRFGAKRDGDLDRAQNVGGIDIKDIGVERTSAGGRIQFNDAAIKAVLDNGFEGFTPVFIQMTPIESPLMIFGLNPEKQPAISGAQQLTSVSNLPQGLEPEAVEI